MRAGRQEAFSLREADDAAPDAQEVAAFERSRVQPELHQEGEHQALHAFYQELLAVRRAMPTLTDPQASRDVMGVEDERVFILQAHTRGGASETFAILSFADTETQVSLPLLAGAWVKRLDAGDARFLGADRCPGSGLFRRSDRAHVAAARRAPFRAHPLTTSTRFVLLY